MDNYALDLWDPHIRSFFFPFPFLAWVAAPLSTSSPTAASAGSRCTSHPHRLGCGQWRRKGGATGQKVGHMSAMRMKSKMAAMKKYLTTVAKIDTKTSNSCSISD